MLLRNTAAFLFGAVGVLFLLVAFLAALGSAQAFLERLQAGPGLMFADAEFLAIIAIACALLGVFALFVSGKFKRK